MHAHFPPFAKPTDAHESALLYRETSEIAAAQDAKLGTENDCLPSIIASLRVVLSRLEAYADWQRIRRDPLAGSFSPNGSRVAISDEIASLRDVLTTEELKGFGIGDVESRHPAHAEALRVADERLIGPESRL